LGKKNHVEPPIIDLCFLAVAGSGPQVHWTDDAARQLIAAALSAVLKAIPRLDQHYHGIGLAQNEIQHEYPFPTGFVDPTFPTAAVLENSSSMFRSW
jgi:hypothetical protein